MALFLLRALLDRTGGDPKDRVVWGFHVDAVAAPQVTAWYDALELAWADAGIEWHQAIQNLYEVTQLQVYDVSAGGPPVTETLATAGDFPTTGAAGPQEVQICISRWTDDSLGRPRKHGRWYVGPLHGQYFTNDRPPTQAVDALTAFQQALHSRLTDIGTTPVVVSRTNGLVTGYDITQYSIDNAWDTQRRRGVDPTDETVFDVLPPAP